MTSHNNNNRRHIMTPSIAHANPYTYTAPDRRALSMAKMAATLAGAAVHAYVHDKVLAPALQPAAFSPAQNALLDEMLRLEARRAAANEAHNRAAGGSPITGAFVAYVLKRQNPLRYHRLDKSRAAAELVRTLPWARTQGESA